MSNRGALPVHSTTARSRPSVSTIDLSIDDDDITDSQPTSQQQDRVESRLPSERQAAQTTVFLTRPIAITREASSKRRKEKAWETGPHDAEMSHRGRKGISVTPQDPDSKKSGSASIGSPYAGWSNGEHDSKPPKKKAEVKGPPPGVFSGAINGAIRQNGKPPVKQVDLNKMSRITKTSSKEPNPRNHLLPELGSSQAPSASTSRGPPPRPASGPALNIKGASKSKVPQAAPASAINKGKAKAEILELSSEDEAPRADQEDEIENADDPITPNPRGKRNSLPSRLQHSGDGVDSSPDPLALGPFNLTQPPRRTDSAWDPPAVPPGYVQNQVQQVEKRAKQQTMVSRLQPKSASRASEPSQRRRGFGDEDNEMDLLPSTSTKATKSTSTTVKSKSDSGGHMITHPIEAYSFGSGFAPPKLGDVKYWIVYHQAGDVGSQRVNICRRDVSNPIISFVRSDCHAVSLSDDWKTDGPMLSFTLKDQSPVFAQISKDCGVNEKDLQEKDESTDLSLRFLPETDSSARHRLWACLKKWGDEPNRIGLTIWSGTAENVWRERHEKALQRTRDRTSTNQSSSRASTSKATSPTTSKRIPRKAQQQTNQDGLQQSLLSMNTGVRRSGRTSTSVYAAPPPPTEEVPYDPIPSEKVVLVYPVGQTSSVVSITHGDTKRLQDSEFLNDTLLELGLKQIQLRLQERDAQAKEQSKRIADSVYMFNSFFYKKLSSQKGKPANSNDETLWNGYLAVKKWTNKVDLFAKKFVVVPINEHFHWYLAIIINPAGIIHCITDPNAPAAPPLRSSARQKARTSPETASAPAVASPKSDTSADPTISRHFPRKSEASLKDPQEDEQEAREEAELQAQVRAAAVGTEMGLDADETGDTPMHDAGLPASDDDVVMEDATGDPTAPRANSVSRQSGTDTNGEESSSDGTEEAQIEADLVTRGSPKEAQPPASRARPMTPPRTRVATPIQPSRSAPGDPPPAAQSEQPIFVGDSPEAPAPVPSPNAPYDPDRCCIYIFDSLGGKHAAVFRYLQRYLIAEASDKHNVKLDDASVKSAITTRYVDVPQQDNLSDCGLYVLHYVDKLLEDPDAMLQHIAEVPQTYSKLRPEERGQWKIIVDSKWDANAAAGKRKVLRDFVQAQCIEYAKYREPLDREEQQAREEKARKRAMAKEAEEARAVAKLAAQREREAQERPPDIVEPESENAQAEDSSMMVEEEAPPTADQVVPASPAGSTTSTRSKKGRGKGKGKGKGKGPRVKKPIEVMELSDSDDEDADLSILARDATLSSTSNGTIQAPGAPKEVPKFVPKRKLRGSEPSSFVNIRSTSPRHSPALEPPIVTESGPSPVVVPQSPVYAAQLHSSTVPRDAKVDVDPSGDLGTPEPDRLHEQSFGAQAIGQDLVEQESPPRKKTRRLGAISTPSTAQQHTASSSTPLLYPALTPSLAVREASRIAERDRPPPALRPPQPSHIRFNDDGRTPLPSSQAGQPRTALEDDLIITPQEANTVAQANFALGAAAGTSNRQTYSVEIHSSSASKPYHRPQQQYHGGPAASSPVEVMVPNGTTRGRSSKEGEQIESMTIDDDE